MESVGRGADLTQLVREALLIPNQNDVVALDPTFLEARAAPAHDLPRRVIAAHHVEGNCVLGWLAHRALNVDSRPSVWKLGGRKHCVQKRCVQ